jgi:hypothetical protein
MCERVELGVGIEVGVDARRDRGACVAELADLN